MFLNFFKLNIHKFKNGANDQATGLCPLHEDKHASFSCNLETGLWICHSGSCGKSGNANQLAELLGIEAPQIISEEKLTEVASYVYQDEKGNPHILVKKFLPKTFRPYHYENGNWVLGLNGTRRILYKLPEIIKSSKVYIVEGEKDADTLWAWGIPATTNISGAAKWKDEYSDVLAGKSIVIIPDNDKAGAEHCSQVVKSLWGKAEAIKIVILPSGKDISEWKESGGTKEELARFVTNTPILTALPAVENQKTRIKQFQLTNLRDLLTEPKEEVNWIVEGLLSKGGLSLIVAKPKTGKSTLARQLALSVARGETFLGRTTSQGLVIYLALEERKTDVRQHFLDMNANGDEEVQIFAEMAPLDVIVQVRSIAEKEKPQLIIVDTLARFARINDLSDYSKVTAGLEPILALAREVGCHVCLLHHGKKGESKGIDSALGSTAIVGTVDTIIELNRSEKYLTTGQNI